MKIPKRKKKTAHQFLLFPEMIKSITKIEEHPPLNSDTLLLSKLEYYNNPAEKSNIGLTTNQIYCGDTVETMKKLSKYLGGVPSTAI